MLRRCAKCKVDKPTEEFRFIQGKKQRYSSYCLVCEKTYNSAYHIRTNHTILYVATYVSVDYCKIGITMNPNTRLRELRQVWPEMDFAAVYDARSAVDIERGLLKAFEAVRFADSEVLQVAAERVIQMIDLMADVLGVRRIDLVPEERGQ